jgi:molecular chaperone DnaJ
MNFYVILGLDRDASTADIKRAYRRLARRYHPGINPGDRAAESVFRQIAEAYETLVDPGKRQAYDAGSGGSQPDRQVSATLEFTEFDFSARAHGSQAATFSELFAEVLNPVPQRDQAKAENGADIHTAVTVEFVDAVRGVERQVVVVRQVACNACGGRGQTATMEARCPHCEGRGTVRWARGHMVFAKSCTSCGGSGLQRAQRCAACGGHARTMRSEGVTVQVPPGTADGARVRIAERGHAGQHGGRSGDLYVTVHVRPHPFYTMHGDNLACVIPVAVHEAVLGGTIEFPGFDGVVRLQIPAGTQPGQRIRVVGRGVAAADGRRGDLIVEIALALPASVDARSMELMREFGNRNNADVRKHLHA